MTLAKLRAADIDQEVKERAIGCMGQLVSQLGDHLQAQLPVCLPILLDRLRNEITRLTTVKALTMIAASPLKVDVRVILGEGAAHPGIVPQVRTVVVREVVSGAGGGEWATGWV